MRRELELAREESSGAQMYLLAAYYLMARNFLMTIVGIGVVMAAVGWAWNLSIGQPTPTNEPTRTFAGMLGVWGASFALFGALSYVALWLLKLRSERRAATN
ncbi:hypothetical protein [Halarchaeum sp. P4]|uniref:hypothetical protein n=1 Tax=Halarchaeum sp. P4 TaxID=3421639 RepID=UPI003EBD6968